MTTSPKPWHANHTTDHHVQLLDANNDLVAIFTDWQNLEHVLKLANAEHSADQARIGANTRWKRRQEEVRP